MYIGYDLGKEWRIIAIPCKASTSEFRVVVPRGQHFLCCTPKFDNYDYIELMKKYENNPLVDVNTIAETPENRMISCLKMGSSEGKNLS